MADGFGFVMNISSLDATSYELAPLCVLRHASDEEVELIKQKLEWANPGYGVPGYHCVPWEKKLFTSPGPIVLLPKQEWRYFVVSFEGNNVEIENLGLASCLTSIELEIGFTLMAIDREQKIPRTTAWHPDRLFHTLNVLGRNDEFFRKVTQANAEEISSINSRLKSADAEVQNLAHQLQSLKGLPHESPLRFLGYFALLESVLTHSPKPEDRYDSITRQVKKKLALLDSRWSRKIDYSPFGGAKHEKIWSTMYEYRSAVAHGGTADFSGDLQLLKGPSEALTLIKETVKAVMRQALIEPQLLRDLREC